MIGRCATCYAWRPADWRGHQPAGPGTCERTRRYGVEGDDTSLAWAIDSDDYHAVLMTEPQFGCVQWEHGHAP